MRKNYFQVNEEVLPGTFLCYNAFSNRFLLLNKDKYEEYETKDIEWIEENDVQFYQTLLNNEFIVSDDFDEYEIVAYKKKMYAI